MSVATLLRESLVSAAIIGSEPTMRREKWSAWNSWPSRPKEHKFGGVADGPLRSAPVGALSLFGRAPLRQATSIRGSPTRRWSPYRFHIAATRLCRAVAGVHIEMLVHSDKVEPVTAELTTKMCQTYLIVIDTETS